MMLGDIILSPDETKKQPTTELLSLGTNGNKKRIHG
jgi:hypothetical protein